MSTKKIVLTSIVILALTSTIVLASANSCGIKRGFLYVSEDGVNFVEVTEDFDVHPGRKYWLKMFRRQAIGSGGLCARQSRQGDRMHGGEWLDGSVH